MCCIRFSDSDSSYSDTTDPNDLRAANSSSGRYLCFTLDLSEASCAHPDLKSTKRGCGSRFQGCDRTESRASSTIRHLFFAILSDNAFGKSGYGGRNFLLPTPNLDVSAVGFPRQFPQVKAVSLYCL